MPGQEFTGVGSPRGLRAHFRRVPPWFQVKPNRDMSCKFGKRNLWRSFAWPLEGAKFPSADDSA